MKYAILRKDGGVSIMDCVEGVSPEDEVAKWPQHMRDNVLSISPITEDHIPQDRTFRNGWKLDGGHIVHDIEKCREIHKDRMRAARAPKLAALDVEYQRADEAGDEARKRQIVKEKQELRDVTELADRAGAVDELSALWPACLN